MLYYSDNMHGEVAVWRRCVVTNNQKMCIKRKKDMVRSVDPSLLVVGWYNTA